MACKVLDGLDRLGIGRYRRVQHRHMLE
jgi:hypothetical protein